MHGVGIKVWYQSQLYDVVEGSIEYESKDRWMRMDSKDQRLMRFISESYPSMVRELRPRFITKVVGSLFNGYAIKHFSGYIYMFLYDMLAWQSTHTDLYYEFHRHGCGPYLYRQLWSVFTVVLYSSLLSLQRGVIFSFTALQAYLSKAYQDHSDIQGVHSQHIAHLMLGVSHFVRDNSREPFIILLLLFHY